MDGPCQFTCWQLLTDLKRHSADAEMDLLDYAPRWDHTAQVRHKWATIVSRSNDKFQECLKALFSPDSIDNLFKPNAKAAPHKLAKYQFSLGTKWV